jgi:hypothetical protein
MNCSAPPNKPDWKAYALGELNAEGRREAENHAASCEACREELASLRLTLEAMSALREEEVPRRIAFVSDKVFEPRWWQRFLNPTFAAACVLAAAIVVHGFAQPSITEEEIQARIDTALAQRQEVLEAYFDTQDKIARQFLAASWRLERQ